ncbi:MAG: tyrosine-type recombinase/integrase [Bacteroidales bacterium]|jgi:integrase/recombinase XerC|nr:tyrosine-type recombinase/integrase [Bacteroidales bacterium]
MLDSFLNYISNEKRYSKHTVCAYAADISSFLTFLEHSYDIEKPEETEAMHIRSWMVELSETKISSRSICRKLASVKAFFKFHKKTGRIDANPALKIQAPKVSVRLPGYIDEKGMEWLIMNQEKTESFESIRNMLIIEMLYQTGMRLSELVNLSWDDVDTTKASIRVMGKRRKERIIPIIEPLQELIVKYRDCVSSHFGSNEKHASIFLTDKGNKIYPKLVYRIVNSYLSMITSMEKKSPHVLRHTFATHMLNSGADLNAIKEILGHSSLAATQVYTHVSIEKLRKIYKQAHPKA